MVHTSAGLFWIISNLRSTWRLDKAIAYEDTASAARHQCQDYRAGHVSHGYIIDAEWRLLLE